MVCQSVEECRRHLRIAEHRRPFAEGKVRGDDDRGALVEPADQVEQERTTGLRERQIAEFIEDDEVEASEVIRCPPLLAVTCFRFQPIDEINDIEEAARGWLSKRNTASARFRLILTLACVRPWITWPPILIDLPPCRRLPPPLA